MVRAISNYNVEKIIGQGGMGKVYLGNYQNNPHKKVAIKELNTDQSSDPNIRLRFQREAEVMAKLNHPGIVKFYDFKFQNGVFYLIMEFVQGQTLSQCINSKTKTLSVETAIHIFVNILEALQYAHNKGITHRDIKPNNIMVLPDNSVKILDFGIARLEKTNLKLTKLGTVLGTPVYMSPEQIRGLTADHRSDIYTLGVLLYYMLTGAPPYNEQNTPDNEIKTLVIQHPLPRIKTELKGIPGYLQGVIDKATEKDMTKRYQSCSEFRNALLNSAPTTSTNQTTNMRTIVIGRDHSCDIVINDNSISRRHAEITIASGQYVYRDTSTNGTLIGGRNICGTREMVYPGTQILLSGKVPLPWDQVQAMLPTGGVHNLNQSSGGTIPNGSAQTLVQPSVPINQYKQNVPINGNSGGRPKNYKTESILVMVFCGIIWGAIALSHANQVDKKYDQGRIYEAEESSRKAKTWCIVGLSITVFFIIISIAGA